MKSTSQAMSNEDWKDQRFSISCDTPMLGEAGLQFEALMMHVHMSAHEYWELSKGLCAIRTNGKQAVGREEGSTEEREGRK